MSLTLFGVIWLLALLMSFFSKKRMVFLLFLSMVFQSTNAIVLNTDIGVGPQIITSAIFIVHVFVSFKNFKLIISYKVLAPLTFFCALLIMLAFNEEFDVKTVMFLIQLYIYIVCFITIYNNKNSYKYEDICKSIVMVIWIVCIMGAIQFLMSSLIIPKVWIFQQLFYNQEGAAETVQFLVERRYMRLFSTFLEPSYCGAFLVAGFFYIISQKSLYENNRLLSVILLLEIALTGSSTAYGALLIGGILFALYGKNKRLLKILIPIAVAFFVFMIFGYDKVANLIATKLASSSGLERARWNQLAWKSFLSSNSIVGLGYKKVRASSLAISLLAQTGIVGTILYIGMILSNVLDRKNVTQSDIAAKIALMCVVAAQIIACPDIDFCVFWLFMYLIAFNGYRTNSRKEKVDWKNHYSKVI